MRKKGGIVLTEEVRGADEQSHYSSGCPFLDSELQSSQTNNEMSNGKRLQRNFHTFFSMFLLVNSNSNFYNRSSAWPAMHFS